MSSCMYCAPFYRSLCGLHRRDALQKLCRRFVVGILLDQLAGKGLLQDALPQGFSLLEALGDGFFEFVGHGEPVLSYTKGRGAFPSR